MRVKLVSNNIEPVVIYIAHRVQENAHFARTLLWRNNHTLGKLFAVYQKFVKHWMHSAGLTMFLQLLMLGNPV